jgi:hypothetical protein
MMPTNEYVEIHNGGYSGGVFCLGMMIGALIDRDERKQKRPLSI